jgi:hypothetical protein
MKINVHQQTCQGAKQYQRDVSTGNYDDDIFSATEVENNPQKYEVTESTVEGREMLRESLTLGKGWVKVREAGVMKPRTRITERQHSFREDANKTLEGYQAQAQARKLTASVEGKNAIFTRGNVKIAVSPDLKWSCNCGQAPASGKDPQTMCSHLDTFHPNGGDQESFRQRTVEAFKLLGMSEEEARIAAKAQGNDLLEAWTKVILHGLPQRPDPRIDILRKIRGRQ